MSRRSAQYAHLVSVCRARGCSREDALDIVQEAHLRLLEYLRLSTVGDAEAILRRIVINLTINHHHSEQTTPFASESIDQLDRRWVLVDRAAGPERALAAEQELDKVVHLLRAVSPRTCHIFIVQRGGYSYEEIAAAFAIKPRTVEKHVTIAMTALTEAMPADLTTVGEVQSAFAAGLSTSRNERRPSRVNDVRVPALRMAVGAY